MIRYTNEQKRSWLDRPLLSSFSLNTETALFIIILILAIISRFYDLGSRVISHDETSHVYFSWLFQQGNGYSHDPVTHGPFQFHLVALSYFLFGDSDFTSRIPAALFSIATIAFMWAYRKILGRAGALIAALLFLISPYFLYYGRYVRNEAFVGLFGVITLWAILRYIESGNNRYIYLLTVATALHFTAKETSFIYTAQALIFLAFFLIYRLSQKSWLRPEYRSRFFIFLTLAVILLLIGGGFILIERGITSPDAQETASPSVPGQGISQSPITRSPGFPVILILLGVFGLFGAIYFVIQGYTWNSLSRERSFSLIIVLGTMVLPMLAPFPVRFLGQNPIDYQTNTVIIYNAIFIGILSIIAIGVGLLWNPKVWLINAAIFYGIFIVLYTTLFTNGFGFITGLVGSLGYWLEQQGVNRGSQPWYYYWLIQIPIYEYLPALGSILAFFFAPTFIRSVRNRIPNNDITSNIKNLEIEEQLEENNSVDVLDHHEIDLENLTPHITTFTLLGFWSITSLVAYTIAGEKMPWLTFHIALPLILLCSWFVGNLIQETDWQNFQNHNGIFVVILLPILFLGTLATIGTLLGVNPPFQGTELPQLKATSTFITALVTVIACGYVISRLVAKWDPTQLLRVILLIVFSFFGILTIRTSVRASFLDYDNATEYLVYAHMARGPKEALNQIEDISRRTTNGLALRVAYDDATTYPYWWYLRNFPNKDYFGKDPTRSQRDSVAILVGDTNYGKIEPIVGQAYQKFEFTRIWWPNQDYFGLTWQRVMNAITNPQMRTAIFKIWLDRDYSLYSQITNQDFSLPNWQPSQKLRLYIRKDVIASLWNYGVSPSPEAIIADPYEGKQIDIIADKIIGEMGEEPGQFKRPRDIALSSDGTLYVTDTDNHRVQHLSPDGSVLHTWGSLGLGSEGTSAQPGTFNEPWGIAVGPDGSVYVADTWNNRIQKFSPDGQFITTWGYGISQTDDPFGFYGPRDVAVNSKGQVFVTDTGNKRIVVFDDSGNYIAQFGGPGFSLGQFDEPVGITVDNQDRIYVADTWNQRIQVFVPTAEGDFSPESSWDIIGWYGQSIDNKPYISIDSQGNLFVADPEGYRVLQFNESGEFIRFWGDYSITADGFGLVGGISPDGDDGVWVVDTDNNRIMHFNLPDE